MTTILLAAALLAAPPAAFAAPAAEKKKPAAEDKGSAGAETLKLVDYVLKTEAPDLNPEVIPPFMEVDLKTLPAGLRPGYRAKVAELEALRKIAESKKKPPIRRAGEEEKTVCPREEGDLAYVKMLQQMGFETISELEEQFLLRRTKCSECELQEEFTLKIIITPPEKKGKKHVQHLLMSKSDPLMGLIARYREGSEGGTDFFGSFHGACR